MRLCNTNNDNSRIGRETIDENDDGSSDNYEQDIRSKILQSSLPYVPEHGWSRDTVAAGTYPRVLTYPPVRSLLRPLYIEKCDRHGPKSSNFLTVPHGIVGATRKHVVVTRHRLHIRPSTKRKHFRSRIFRVSLEPVNEYAVRFFRPA